MSNDKEQIELLKRANNLVKKVASRVIKKDAIWGNYCLNLAHESMLEFDRLTEETEFTKYVFSVMDRRGWTPDTKINYTSQPFCHVNYKQYEVTQDKRYLAPFIEESIRFFEETGRLENGLALHTDKDFTNKNVLIDFIQDYCSRMAQIGVLTGEQKYIKESVLQHRYYREMLMDPETNLWSTGRGWMEEDSMMNSPGNWSRGHGWLIRGMVDTLTALPKDTEEHNELQTYLQELSDALLKVQDKDGMWHQLMNRNDETYPDTTGTGLICYNLCKALLNGFLEGDKYKNAALSAFKGLEENVSEEGIVHRACPGPGPLFGEEPYINNPGNDEDGEGHGPMAIMFACSGMYMLDKA